MAIVKQVVGTRTALTSTGFSTLASATYVATSAYSSVTNQPLYLMVEVTAATTNVPAGNKQVVVFAVASLDNTNYQSGPQSGTAATDEPLLSFLGVVAIATTSVSETKLFSVANAYGGVLPPFVKIVLKNDTGVALTTGSVATSEISSTVV